MIYLINDKTQSIVSAIDGYLAMTDSDLFKRAGKMGVVYPNPDRKVRVVIGGGSGHEPLFIGMVGPGMADGAALGHIFTAPSPGDIEDVVHATQPEEGVVFVYGNYSGDALNFDLAGELLEESPFTIGTVRVCDDVASAPAEQMSIRRGIAGGVFVIKCISAAADQQLSYDEVIRIGQKANHHVRSIGVATKAATSVSTGQPMFSLPDGEIEIGMGIHGEMGVRRTQFESLETLVNQMVTLIMDDYEKSDDPIRELAVVVNGLGSTTMLELLNVVHHVRQEFDQRDCKVTYLTAGQMVSSLDMGGFSISVMNMDDELKSLWSVPARTFGFQM